MTLKLQHEITRRGKRFYANRRNILDYHGYEEGDIIQQAFLCYLQYGSVDYLNRDLLDWLRSETGRVKGKDGKPDAYNPKPKSLQSPVNMNTKDVENQLELQDFIRANPPQFSERSTDFLWWVKKTYAPTDRLRKIIGYYEEGYLNHEIASKMNMSIGRVCQLAREVANKHEKESNNVTHNPR